MGRSLKIGIAVLLAFLILIVLNAYALNNETEPASITVEGATLVETTSGELQVLDTGSPSGPVDTGLTPGPLDPTLPAPLPVVLIHGTGGAINWWDDLIPLLEPNHRVVAIDMLGFGGSAKPNSGYSIENQASLIAQALTGIGVGKAVIVGHSLGSKVATSLTEQSPALVAGITVLDMAPDSSYGGLSGAANAAQLPLVGPALWRISPDFMVRRNVAQAFAPGYDAPDKFVDDVRQLTYPSYSSTYDESTKYTDAQPLDERLESVGVPLLVIFGEEDQLYPARESISAYAAIPGVQTLLIPGVGHSPQVEAPDKTAAAISLFADSLLPEPEPANKPQPNRKNGQAGKNKQNNKKKQNGSKQKNNGKKPNQGSKESG